MNNLPIETRRRLLGESVVKALRARYFEADYYPTAAEAVKAAQSLIPLGSQITFGGSMTIWDTGLVSALSEGRQVFDRGSVPPEERAAFVQAHYFSDWFLSSANAITEDGVIVNMDGTGNRVASLIYGPRNVLMLVGMNKITRDFEGAVARVRGTAAPINAQRFDVNTPCKKTGRCADCKFPDSICCSLTVMRLCRPAGRIHVMLFGEDAGF